MRLCLCRTGNQFEFLNQLRTTEIRSLIRMFVVEVVSFKPKRTDRRHTKPHIEQISPYNSEDNNQTLKSQITVTQSIVD